MFLKGVVFVFLLCVGIAHSDQLRQQQAEIYFRDETTKIYNLCGKDFVNDSQKNVVKSSETSKCLEKIYAENARDPQFFKTLTIEFLKSKIFTKLGMLWSRYGCLELLKYTMLSLANFGRADECRHIINLEHQLINDKNAVFVSASKDRFYNTYGPLALMNSALNPQTNNEPRILVTINREAEKVIENAEELEQKLETVQPQIDDIKNETRVQSQKKLEWLSLKHKKIENIIASIYAQFEINPTLTRIFISREWSWIRIFNKKGCFAPKVAIIKEKFSAPQWCGTNAEYVFYKDGDEISPQSKKSIYEVISIIPFPMNTNPLNTEHIRKLSLEELNDLDINEPKVVYSKIVQIDPDVRMLLIPKSMVQLFVLLLFLEELPTYELYNANNEEARRQYNKWEEMVFSMRNSAIGKYNNANSVHAVSKSYLESQPTQDLFWRLCNRIVKFVKGIIGNLENFTRENFIMVCDALINEITEKIDKATHWHKWGARIKFFYLRKKENTDKRTLVKDHIKWVLEQEYNTMEDPNKRGTYRIYRGGHKGTAYGTNESSSFGDGAFSSIIFSPRNDMPFNIALGKGALAYIDVNKRQYRTTQNFPVFIPSVPAYIAVLGEGEYHHPRTLVYNAQGRIPGVYKENAAALDENIDDRWLITNNLNQLKELLNSIKVFDRSFLVQ